MFDDIIRSVQVCIPFRLLQEKHLPMVIQNRINPEIGIDGDVLDACPAKTLANLASRLKQEGLSITLHGPFFDLVPGGMDKKILQATRDRLTQLFDLVPLFEPKTVVCHTGYDRKRYYTAQDQWLETALETWRPFVAGLEGTGTTLVIENVYEKTPQMLVRLLNGLGSKKARFCFDTGHMNAFSETTMEGWLDALGALLGQIHLHDNDGTWDHHWALGAGEIHFEVLFRYLEENRLRPVITLEAHHEDWLWQSLETLSRSPHFHHLIARH